MLFAICGNISCSPTKGWRCRKWMRAQPRVRAVRASRCGLTARPHRPRRCSRSLGELGIHTPYTRHTGKKICSYLQAPLAETRDRTAPVSDQRDCPPPPLALTAQDSVPRITATHSGGHHARRGCEAKSQDWGSRWWDHEGGRAGSCGGEMLRGEFEPPPSPRRSSRGG